MKKKDKRSRIAVAASIIGSVIVSIYLAGMISSAFYGDQGVILNPVKMVRWMGEYGFPVFLTISTFAVLACVIAGMYMFATRNKKETPATVNIEDRFEKPEDYKDVAAVRSPEEALGTIVGQLDDSGQKLITEYTKKRIGNNHMLVLGPAGSGKTFTFTNNYILQAVRRRESLVITDVDGSIESTMRGYLLKKGYVVRTLDLKDLDKSDGWDCLKSLSASNPEYTDVNATVFADAIVKNGDVKEDEYRGAVSLLKALLLRVYLAKDPDIWYFAKDENRNIKSVYDQLMHDDVERDLDGLFDESIMSPEEKRCLAAWRGFVNQAPYQKKNIIASLCGLLQELSDSKLVDVLSKDEIDLGLPGEVPCVYFCRFHDVHPTYQFVPPLFITMLIQSLTDKADATPDGKLKVPVNFLLDDFGHMGTIHDLARKMAVVRKRNINIVMIAQSLTQLQSLYKEDWTYILQNSSTVICQHIIDMESVEYLQKRIGKTMIVPDSCTNSSDVMSPAEILDLNSKYNIIIFRSHNATLAKMYPYTNHPDAKNLCEDPIGDKPSFYDEEGMAKRRAAEDALRKMYYDEHPDDQHKDEVPT